MTILRIQTTHPYTSGLPSDVVVTTMHFEDLNPGGDPDGIAAVVKDFWRNTTGSTSPEELMSSLISRTIPTTLDVYDLSDPEPRAPVHHEEWLCMAQEGAGVALPPEVCVCLTWTADQIAGVPASRTRGRSYIGPLAATAVDGTGRVLQSVRDDLRINAQRLLLDSGAVAPMVIWSRPKPATLNKDGSPNPARPGTAYTVTDGWIDNEFDTQRRRGRKASIRDAFQGV